MDKKKNKTQSDVALELAKVHIKQEEPIGYIVDDSTSDNQELFEAIEAENRGKDLKSISHLDIFNEDRVNISDI